MVVCSGADWSCRKWVCVAEGLTVCIVAIRYCYEIKDLEGLLYTRGMRP